MNTLSIAVGVSALTHSAAIGLLLALLKPVPYADLAQTIVAVEVSIEFEPAPVTGRPKLMAGNVPSEDPADVSAIPPSPVRPNVTATPPRSDGLWSANMSRSFDLPAPATFKSLTQSPGLDMLGAMLDCLTVEGSSRGVSKDSLRLHPPCAYPDLAPRPPVTKFQKEASKSTEGAPWADEAYRTFGTVQPLFDESLFPGTVPEANRAFKKRMMGLFH